MKKYIIIAFFSIGLLAGMIGCKKDGMPGHNAGAAMVIDSFIATHGGGGTEVLISGSNFSADTSSIHVIINGHQLALVGANYHQIMAVVPKRCGSGHVIVKIGGDSAVSAGIFIYTYTRTVSTFAGSGVAGFANGQGTDAKFNFNARCGLDVDTNLNVYVADPGNHCIRKITPDGTVTTLAGNPNVGGYQDGTGATALFQTPYDVATDYNGNVYSVDPWNWDIRKIAPNGTATTIGWSIGSGPTHIGINKQNGIVYYTAHDAGKINMIQTDGTNSTIIDGLAWPSDMVVAPNGDLFLVLHDAAMISRYTVNTWNRTILAGQDGVYGYRDGAGTDALFSSPWCISIDLSGNLYIAGNGDGGGSTSNPDQSIRYIEAGTWTVSTFAGSGTAGYVDAVGSAAEFSAPTGVAVDKNGTVYVLDRNNNRIRKIVSE